MTQLAETLRSKTRGPRLAGRLLLSEPRSLRFARAWRRSLEVVDEPIADRSPWLPFRAQMWLDRNLSPDMSVFEYGSGGSTFFGGSRVQSLVSVDHDAAWHAEVSAGLAGKGIDTCICLLREPDPLDGEPFPVYGFTSCTSWREDYRGLDFRTYVQSIDPYPDASFDAVIVDGRARLSCIERAIPKVKPGGYLLLDNSERPEYREAFSRLAAFPREDLFGFAPYRTYPWQFSVWRMSPHAP